MPGEIPAVLRPAGDGIVRVDSYDLASLTPAAAWKRRGDGGRVELKLRSPQVVAVRVDGVAAVAEQWRKERLAHASTADAADWLAVRKRLWERVGLQITELEIGGERWTSLAVGVEHAAPTDRRALVGRWRDHLEAMAVPASYPTFLLAKDVVGHAAAAVADDRMAERALVELTGRTRPPAAVRRLGPVDGGRRVSAGWGRRRQS